MDAQSWVHLNLHNEEIDQLMQTEKLTEICYGYQN
jgi:hypothetical protein